MFNTDLNAFIGGMMYGYFRQDPSGKKHPCSKVNCPLQCCEGKGDSPCYSFGCQWYTPKYSNEEIAGFLRYLAELVEKRED